MNPYWGCHWLSRNALHFSIHISLKLNEKIKISASFPNLITKDSIISLKFICFHLWLLPFKKKICGDLDFFSFWKKSRKMVHIMFFWILVKYQIILIYWSWTRCGHCNLPKNMIESPYILCFENVIIICTF